LNTGRRSRNATNRGSSSTTSAAVVPATIAQYGGKFLVRGGAAETLEGSWSPKRLVVLEFPSVEQARAWYSSDAYAEALAFRDRALERRLTLVEGLPDAP
jgi:uncharacterized protein (DUF1330 family)